MRIKCQIEPKNIEHGHQLSKLCKRCKTMRITADYFFVFKLKIDRIFDAEI